MIGRDRAGLILFVLLAGASFAWAATATTAVRAESVEAADERAPMLYFRSLGGTSRRMHTECVLVNGTGSDITFPAQANGDPRYVIERRPDIARTHPRPPGDGESSSTGKLPPGGTIRFVADVTGISVPFRVRVDVRRDRGTPLIGVFSRVIRIPSSGPLRDPGIPLVLCDLVTMTLTHQVDPIYPDVARLARLHGDVVVEALVDRSGAVSEARVVEGQEGPLGLAALKAVRQWRYSAPRDHMGRSITVTLPITVKFELTGSAHAEAGT